MNQNMLKTADHIFRRFPEARFIWLRQENHETIDAVFFGGTEWFRLQFLPHYGLSMYCDRIFSSRRVLDESDGWVFYYNGERR